VLEKTIDWAWEQNNLVPALQQLLSRRDLRTNDGFLSKVIELSDFLDTVVSRQNWYERTAQLAEVANPFATELGRKQKQIIAEKLEHILNQLRHVTGVGNSKRAIFSRFWNAANFWRPAIGTSALRR
jgi:type I site-specific restriction endonuclease